MRWGFRPGAGRHGDPATERLADKGTRVADLVDTAAVHDASVMAKAWRERRWYTAPGQVVGATTAAPTGRSITKVGEPA